MKIALIGTGRMGFTQAHIARYFGDEIVTAVEPDDNARVRFSNMFHVNSAQNLTDAASTLLQADLVWITVTDNQIAAVAQQMHDIPLHGVVLHTSGALSSDIIRPHLQVPCGALHPMMSCPLPDCPDEDCVKIYHGVLHCFDGDTLARIIANQLIKRIHAQMVEIPACQKAAYHAAAVFASNYPIVLIHHAMQLLQSCGFDAQMAKSACLRLLNQAANAMETHDPLDALTGPAKRRDTQTIQMHISALQSHPDILKLYQSMLDAANQMCGYRH